MSKAIINLGFVIGTAFCLELLSLYVYSFLAPKYDMGWDALANFLGFFMISSIAAIIIAIVLSRFVSDKVKKIVGLTAGLAAVIVVVGFIIYQQRVSRIPEQPQRPTTLPAEPTPEAMSQQSGEPIPEVLAKLLFKPSDKTFFYGGPEFDALVVDSIVFSSRGEIEMAPPWLLPYYMKTDYQMMLFEGISRTKSAIQVGVNRTNSQSHWLRNEDVTIWDTPMFLLHCQSVERLQPSNNLLRIKPLRHASPIPLKEEETLFQPLEVKGDWLRVRVLNSDCSPTDREGWIMWKDNGQVAVTYNLLC